jgi:integrase
MKKEKNITEIIPNRKYRIDIERGKRHDGTRNRYTETFTGNLKEAISRRDDIIYEFKHEKVKPDGNMNFLEYAKFWLENYAVPIVKDTTLYGYRCNLNAYILPRFKNYKLNEIKVYDLERFYRDLAKRPIRYSADKDNPRILSSTTILKQHRQLCIMFNTAIKWDFIDSNPCLKVLKPPTKAIPEMAYYNEAEIKKLLKLLEDEDIDLKTAVYMLILGGFRRAELLGLHNEDINWEKHTVKISKNLLNIRGKGIIESTPKTVKSNRTVILPNKCFELLKEYEEVKAERKKILGKNYHESPYVFQSVFGGCMKPDWLSHAWKNFLKRNNFKEIRLHDLRHTCATYLISLGVPLLLFQENSDIVIFILL